MNDHGFDPEVLIFDALTFPLGAGQVIRGCCCALNSSVRTWSAASISLRVRFSFGVSLKMSMPRAISASGRLVSGVIQSEL